MTTRRSLLQGICIATTAPVTAVAAGAVCKSTTVNDSATDPARLPKPAVFQQQGYFNFDNNGAAYTPPSHNQATVDYRAGLTAEAFLRRHWFC